MPLTSAALPDPSAALPGGRPALIASGRRALQPVRGRQARRQPPPSGLARPPDRSAPGIAAAAVVAATFALATLLVTPAAADPGRSWSGDAHSFAGPAGLPRIWRWPLVPAPRVLRAFDAPPLPWLPGHRGVDLAAVPGQPVLSAGTGIVVFAGPLSGRGVVSVEYGGIRSSYEPVVPSVKPGDPVILGEPIGVLAPVPLHCRTRSCLRWGAFVSLSVPRRYIDPRVLVGAGPIRLLPDGFRGRSGLLTGRSQRLTSPLSPSGPAAAGADLAAAPLAGSAGPPAPVGSPAASQRSARTVTADQVPGPVRTSAPLAAPPAPNPRPDAAPAAPAAVAGRSAAGSAAASPATPLSTTVGLTATGLALAGVVGAARLRRRR